MRGFRKTSNSATKVLILLSCWCKLQSLSSILVKSEKKLSAAVGGDVTLMCQLMTTIENVIQITWQKESGKNTGPVATTSKVYGQRVLGHYSNRAKYSSVGVLNVSAINISPVTLEDEGCFKCIFNLFPVGASYGTICLDVYEEKISELTLDVEIIDFPKTMEKLLVVTCIGSGLPAPNISWNLSVDLLFQPQTFSTVNPDGTVTVTSNLTHPISKSIEGTEVTCVHHPALGIEKRLSKMVHYTAQSYSIREVISTKGSRIRFLIVIPIAISVFIVLLLSIGLSPGRDGMAPTDRPLISSSSLSEMT